jgi:hypothetical protein
MLPGPGAYLTTAFMNVYGADEVRMHLGFTTELTELTEKNTNVFSAISANSVVLNR